ncbi:MAG: response regulator [Chitinophagaceae bacterium]
MNTFKAILVDDEERARNFLSNLLQKHCPEIDIISLCSNVPDAVLAIHKWQPDLVFLDIEMPDYNGFELLQFFKEIDFEIVFVTAYSEFAIKAFEISALDYLLKPVDAEVLKQTVVKLKEKRSLVNISKRIEVFKEAYRSDDFSKIALPVSDGILFVDIVKIVCLEASGAYTYVVLKDGSKVLVSKKLIFFEQVLENKKTFFRIHRSYLINLNFIAKYFKGEGLVLMDNQLKIPISKDRKQDFEAAFKEIRIG